MRVDSFFKILNADFYTGVPDSQLKALCDFLLETYGTDPAHHVIAANEGNAVGLAAGYHLATGHVPVVYMQNSGEGNVINPVASLLSEEVYGIPCLFVIGWRGEPGVKDEPQHAFQGKVTCKLLEVMDIEYRVLGPDTTEEEFDRWMLLFKSLFESGKSAAIVVRKGALEYSKPVEYKNDNVMTREEVLSHIVRFSGEDPIVSTTGKASRELFEIRERETGSMPEAQAETGQGVTHGREVCQGKSNETIHAHDFLTVGSMGHASSIALGIALQKPESRVWCIDGDGAALMHLGAMAVIGDVNPKNLVHVVINNGAHESVGGQPTAARDRELRRVAEDLGYVRTYRAEDFDELDRILEEITGGAGCAAEIGSTAISGDGAMSAGEGPIFLEILCAIGAREDLGRPTTSPKENKQAFMDVLCCQSICGSVG